MLDFPATTKNREVIAERLAEIFDGEKKIKLLELASGSGQHATYFAQRFPHWSIQPSDLDPENLRSISAYRKHHELSNVAEPKQVDVASSDWNLNQLYDGILAINLIHISPWETTLGLFDGASRLLTKHGRLYLYGAYLRNGEHTSPSNAAFDQSLRATDPRWGVRCLDEVTEVAQKRGLRLVSTVQMPANNLSLVFDKNL